MTQPNSPSSSSTTPNPSTTGNANSSKDAFEKVANKKLASDATEPESTVWAGGYSPKAMIGVWVLSAFLTLLAIILYLVVLRSVEGVPSAGILTAIVLCWWIGAGLLYAYRRIGTHYQLTSQRFIHKNGILVQTTDRIETIDIDDVTYTQGIIQRILGVGTIKLSSSDHTHPEFFMLGIDQVDKVAEMFDKVRMNERRRRGLHIESV